MTKELRFDSLLPKQVPVHIGDKTYKLTAASSATSNRFRAALAKCSKVVGEQTVISDPSAMVRANMELVSECLRDPEGKNVQVEEFKEWPSEIIEAILQETIDLCGFGGKTEDQEEDLKN